jgi:circadian clock protein KaiB
MKKPRRVVPKTHDKQVYVFRLFVADAEQNSQLARKNLEHLCRERLKGQWRIEEVDVLTDFTAALADGVFVTPTVILVAPGPRATIVGNLVDTERVVSALRLGS